MIISTSRSLAGHLQWQGHPPEPLTAVQRRWLTAPGSLTSRLEALGAFSLKVLRETVASASCEQASALGIAEHSPIWCREVLMSVQARQAVFARSLTPWSSGGPAWPELTELGSQALREILYERQGITRSGFTYCLPDSNCREHLPEYTADAAPLLARRSCFHRGGAPLLVSEFFLPGFWRWLEMERAA